jgi:nucleotide-binding universal stress UspA family protein
MQNILIPTDFSDNADHALSFATELLKSKACNFFLLNVQKEHKESSRPSMEGEERKSKKARSRLDRTLRRMEKSTKNTEHTFRPILARGNFTDVVHESIKQLNIDLMVMGSKGKKSSIPVFLGTTTTKALKTVQKCPVLVVPKDAEIGIPKEIAFASDYKRRFDGNVIEPLRTVALLSRAAIHVVHMGEEDRLDKLQADNLSDLVRHLSPIPHSTHIIPNFISKTKIIQFFLKNQDIDMLAMVNYKGGYLEQIFREPVITKMIFHIDIPFLVLPDRD